MVARVKTPPETARAVRLEKVRGALLGLAFGDALGWPFEGRAKRPSDLPDRGPNIELFSWIKRGGRFQPDEPIEAGEYSDDTQLTLATARSALLSDRHWEQFAFGELPTWLLYERGGGRATKAAARALSSGALPWEMSKQEDRKSYFEAGGNGVAMRILPLVVLRAGDSSFEALARDVVANAVTTHGHPRALVGGLATAYLQWYALRLDRTLEYGELSRALLNDIESWSALPDVSASWSGWWHRAELSVARYDLVWKSVVDEFARSLRDVCHSLASGALAVDNEVLSSIGALDRATNGAGTVCAAAAAYLASRHAASPRSAVVAAATAKGADTDTLASMVGSILGCLAGDDWLGYSTLALQDKEYLAKVAANLLNGRVLPESLRRVSEGDIGAVKRLIADLPIGAEVELPDGRRGTMAPPREISHGVALRCITLDDGQTIHVSVRRASRRVSQGHVSRYVRALLRLDVLDLSRSEKFYAELLGMPVVSRTDRLVVFDAFALKATPEASMRSVENGIVLMVEVDDPEAIRQELALRKVRLDREELDRRGRKSFRVRDPDGYVVEVLERR